MNCFKFLNKDDKTCFWNALKCKDVSLIQESVYNNYLLLKLMELTFYICLLENTCFSEGGSEML
jgi:hypothetical protein